MYNILKSNIFRKIIDILFPVLNFMNRHIKKKSNTVLFFDSKEVYLNNFALYKYMIENNYNQSNVIYYSMPSEDLEVFNHENVIKFTGLLRTLFIFLRVETVFIDIGTLRIEPGKGQNIINLWHGTPLKNIGHMSKSKNKHLSENSLSHFSFITVAADAFDDIYSQSFKIDRSKILHINQTRNDYLYRHEIDTLSRIDVDRTKYNKIVMWMTTYRISADARLIHANENWSSTNIPLLNSIDELIKFNDAMQAENILVIIKIHHGSALIDVDLPEFSHIFFLEELSYIKKGLQLYEILGQTDALVTDYSSVYFDYLLVDKPIIFIIDDLDEFQKLNGFVFDNPLDYMPGAHVTRFDQLVSEFRELNRDKYATDRVRINKLVNQYNYESNCKKILEFIKENK